jgi:hypothetical protein
VDGKVACWGQVEYDDDSVAVERRAGMSTPHLLVGVAGAIDVVHEWFYVCVAQRADAGDGRCFVTNDIDRKPPDFPSPPVELQAGNHGICATMRDGTVGCVDLDGKFTDAGVRDLSQLTCSDRGCCGITKAGAVACFGDDRPKLPKLPPASAVVVAHDEGCIRTRAGGAQCWGDDAKTLTRASGVRGVARVEYSPCVILDDGTMRCASTRVPEGTGVAAADYSCVLHTAGAVSCTSHNSHGELGDGGTTLSPVPLQVPGVDGVVALNVAHVDVCAVRRDKSLWCWGGSLAPADRGDVGGTPIPAQYVSGCRNTGTSIRCGVPTLGGDWESDSIMPPRTVKTIKTAAIHRDGSICLVDGAGAVVCRHGMSEGGVDDRWVPLAAPAAVEELDPLAVGFCARHADGRVSCFVDHRYDNDDDFLETLPAGKLTLVPGIEHATTLVTGQDIACVLTKTSEVWCWRADADAPRPWQMSSLTGATALGAGDRHHCAVLRGDVWCWGDGFLGQLGTGGGTGRIQPAKDPVRVKASFKAVQVGTGRESSCALDDQGKVWCWGANTYGQLGQPRVHRADGWSKVVGIGPP